MIMTGEIQIDSHHIHQKSLSIKHTTSIGNLSMLSEGLIYQSALNNICPRCYYLKFVVCLQLFHIHLIWISCKFLHSCLCPLASIFPIHFINLCISYLVVIQISYQNLINFWNLISNFVILASKYVIPNTYSHYNNLSWYWSWPCNSKLSLYNAIGRLQYSFNYWATVFQCSIILLYCHSHLTKVFTMHPYSFFV